MKKTIFTIITVLCFVNLQAQFEKGSNWVGGSFNFNLSGSKSSNSSLYKSNAQKVDLNLSYNYFKTERLINNYFMGFSYNGSLFSYNDTTRNDFQGVTYRIGFGQNNLYPLISNKLFTTIGYSIYGDYRKSTTEPELASKYKSRGFSASGAINLGLMYSINKRFALTTTLNNLLYVSVYTTSDKNYNNTTEYTNSTYGINGGFGLFGFNLGNLQFGLMYRLNGK